MRYYGELCHGKPPAPATTEPPEWNGGVEDLEVGQKFKLDGRPMVITGIAQTAPGTPDEIIDRVTDALEAFVARRKEKRDGVAPQSPDDHPWARAGHTHANWSTDACPKCLLTGQEVKEIGYYPKCDDFKREREGRAKIARAMSAPVSFTARLGGR